MLRKQFGRHIRCLREQRHMTQTTLARLSDLSVDAVRRIESGSFSPSLSTLSKLVRGLRVSFPTLFSTLERRDPVAELCDFVESLPDAQRDRACRVLRAIFDDGMVSPKAGPG